MATLELTTLSDKLDEEDVAALIEAYTTTGGGPLDIDDVAEQAILDNGIDDDVFVDFVDKLEANDAAADIYLPSDFEDVFVAGDLRVGSAHSLLLVLENLREDFNAEDEDDEDAETEESDVDPFVVTIDDEGEFFDDDGDDGDDSSGTHEDDAGVGMKEEQLLHIWKLMSQGAKAAIRRGLCLFVR